MSNIYWCLLYIYIYIFSRHVTRVYDMYIFLLHLFFHFKFYWNIINLQCYYNLCCTTKWCSCTRTHIHSFSDSFPICFTMLRSFRVYHGMIQLSRHIHLYFRFFPLMDYYRILCRVHCAIQQVPLGHVIL